jgi:hypothetical protein
MKVLMIDLPALFEDIAVGLLEPFGSTAIKAYMERRKAEARQMLIEEVRKAVITTPVAASEDDAIATLFRFDRAVMEGAARINLRLMAKTMVGHLQLGTLVADEFLLYADALAAASRDELILSVELLRTSGRRFPWLPEPRRGDFQENLKAAGWSRDRIYTTAIRAQRVGFTVTGNIQNTPVFGPGFVLLEIAKTVDFDDALRAEGIALSMATPEAAGG